MVSSIVRWMRLLDVLINFSIIRCMTWQEGEDSENLQVGCSYVSAGRGLDHLPLISVDCSPQGAETRWASSTGPEGGGGAGAPLVPSGTPCITYLLSIFFILLWCSFWLLCVFVNHFKSFSWKVPVENDLLRFLQGKLDLFTVLLPLLPSIMLFEDNSLTLWEFTSIVLLLVSRFMLRECDHLLDYSTKSHLILWLLLFTFLMEVNTFWM